MPTRNAALQARLSQVTRHTTRPSEREIELATFEQDLKEKCTLLQERVMALQVSQDEACHRGDSLAIELVAY